MIKANPWTKVFSPFTPEDAISLISKLLTYKPTIRFSPLDAMAHEYFDDIRSPDCALPGDKTMPQLFNFSKREVRNFGRDFATKLIPAHVKLPFDVEAVLASAESAVVDKDDDLYQGYTE